MEPLIHLGTWPRDLWTGWPGCRPLPSTERIITERGRRFISELRTLSVGWAGDAVSKVHQRPSDKEPRRCESGCTDGEQFGVALREESAQPEGYNL